ncbi:MAG: TolC family protein [Porticoccaceae bacterium]|nr:TolC family protein [Porticoccaceae bacterium]
MKIVTIFLALFTSAFIPSSWAGQAPLGRQQAIAHAVSHDPWIRGSQLNERALLADSIAASALPDPRLSLGLLNLARDTLDFDQEPMSQFKLGLEQQFPRGDTLKLQRRQKREQSAAHPFLREDRRARVTRQVSLLWFDAFLARQSVALIENKRYLFEQLVDIAHANYTATSGATRQQDVIRAELELSRLNDRLTLLWQGHDAARQALSEWLSEPLGRRALPDTLVAHELAVLNMDDQRQVLKRVMQHPRVLAIERNMASLATGLELARQQYKPQWGINAAYAYRDNAPGGSERADFVSLGLTVDLPLFTANRQDQRVLAASHRRAAIQTERQLLLRELLAGYRRERAELQRLDEREGLFQQYLLPQIQAQADATLAAYTADGGSFAEVMRVRIEELNTNIMALEITVQRQKTLANMQYFVAAGVASRQGKKL